MNPQLRAINHVAQPYIATCAGKETCCLCFQEPCTGSRQHTLTGRQDYPAIYPSCLLSLGEPPSFCAGPSASGTSADDSVWQDFTDLDYSAVAKELQAEQPPKDANACRQEVHDHTEEYDASQGIHWNTSIYMHDCHLH